MLSLSPSVRIFLCREPADMRRAFDGLARMAVEFMGSDPLSGHLFVFRNKRCDRVKILYWDRDAYRILTLMRLAVEPGCRTSFIAPRVRGFTTYQADWITTAYGSERLPF